MSQILAAIMQAIESPLFQSAFWTVVLAMATHIVSKLAAHAVGKLLHHDSNPLPTSSIIVNIVRAIIWVIGGSIILDSCFNVNTSSLVTALGVGGIAVSLGFQDTLSNLIGGLTVTLTGIVKPGDNIEVGGQTGVVQDVGWRHTTIRDALGQTIIIPNSVISTTSLSHLLPANRVVVPFAIPRAQLAEGERGAAIDELAGRIVTCARDAAAGVSPVVDGPRVFFSETTELGFKGKVVLQIEDVSKTALAADAVVRALARDLC